MRVQFGAQHRCLRQGNGGLKKLGPDLPARSDVEEKHLGARYGLKEFLIFRNDLTREFP